MMDFPSLHEFTEQGMGLFDRVFNGELGETAIDPLDALLVNEIPGTGQFTVAEYETAKEMASAVLEAMRDVSLHEVLPRTGLWAWLTYVLRDQLFRRAAGGSLLVGEVHRWYPSDPGDWLHGQRHLVRMPILLLDQFGSGADHLLCSKPSVLPEIREQLTSQQDMFNPLFQSVARTLYFDDNGGRLKPGAGGKGPGSPRRLAKLRQQFDVTWDLEDLEHDKVIMMLPKEYKRFVPASFYK